MDEINFPNGLTRRVTVPTKVVTTKVVRRTIIKTPSLARQAWTYSKAVARWKLAGSPTRTTEEITSILAICQACPHYTQSDRPRCRLCGCSVNNQPNGLANKIAMATEGCPDDPPKWTAAAV